VYSVTAVMRLSVSWISSMADWFQVPAVSTATGKKTWEAESAPYFTILFAAALFAAEHASLTVWSTKYALRTLVQAYLHCRHSAGLLQRYTSRNSKHCDKTAATQHRCQTSHAMVLPRAVMGINCSKSSLTTITFSITL